MPVLATLGHKDEFDIVTMWCVLAHVPNGDQLLRLGTDVVAVPKARYSLSSELYLYFAGLRGGALRAGSKVMDQFVSRGTAPRIVMDVAARKPLGFAHSSQTRMPRARRTQVCDDSAIVGCKFVTSRR